MCDRTGQNYSCPIPNSTEIITVEGVDIDLGVSTTMTGTFSSPTELVANFQMTFTCLDVDDPFWNCGLLSDYLPCEVDFTIPATVD